MLLKFFISILFLLTLFSPSYSSLKYPPYDTYDTLLEPYNIFFSKECSNYTKNTSFEIWAVSNDTAYVGYTLDYILVSIFFVKKNFHACTAVFVGLSKI